MAGLLWDGLVTDVVRALLAPPEKEDFPFLLPVPLDRLGRLLLPGLVLPLFLLFVLGLIFELLLNCSLTILSSGTALLIPPKGFLISLLFLPEFT
jgi:hypothetical protein